MAYSGDPYLWRQAELLLEKIKADQLPSGQVPHHYDGRGATVFEPLAHPKPVYVAISTAAQTGPNLFFVESAITLAQVSGHTLTLTLTLTLTRILIPTLTRTLNPACSCERAHPVAQKHGSSTRRGAGVAPRELRPGGGPGGVQRQPVGRHPAAWQLHPRHQQLSHPHPAPAG